MIKLDISFICNHYLHHLGRQFECKRHFEWREKKYLGHCSRQEWDLAGVSSGKV